ncbi:DUF4276 family protein [Rickettsiales bacterium LUAb2]
MGEIEIGISVEGQTEAYFIQYVLARYLYKFGIKISPPVILGGNVSVERVGKQLSMLSEHYKYVTSLYDFYGFQGKGNHEGRKHLIHRIMNHVSPYKKDNVIFPYIQMYEFEALLFSDSKILCNNIFYNSHDKIKCIDYFDDILKSKRPEQVNDSIETAPSKRLHKINRRYKKTLYGHIVAQKIGIEKIRKECKGFNGWIEFMISLKNNQHNQHNQHN